MTKWIPLLSPKPFSEFTPEEYHTYICSMYHKPEKQESKSVKVLPPYEWKLTPKGALSVTVNRTDKSLTRAEIDQLAKESGRPLNEVWNYLTIKRKVLVSDMKVSTKK